MTSLRRRAWRSGRMRAQEDSKTRTDPRRAFDLEKPAMMVEDVLDDRQAEAGAANLARARRIDPGEPFRQSRQVPARNALAVLPHSHRNEWGRAELAVVRRPQHGIGGDRDLCPGTPV